MPIRWLVTVLLFACLAPRCAQAQMLSPCRLMGPEETLDLPPAEPLILHVFSPQHDAHEPELAALREHANRGFPFEQVFVAVTVHPDETHDALAAQVDRLVYDVGGETLRFPFGLRGFTTVIIDPRGFVTRIGHPSQPGFMVRLWTTGESLQEALALTGHRRRGPADAPARPAQAEAPAGRGQVPSQAPEPPADPAEAPSVWALATPFVLVGVLAVVLGGRWRSDSRQRLEHVLALQPGLRCAVCGQLLARHEALVACAACSGVSHSTCQRAAGGCQTVGCADGPQGERSPGGFA